MYFSGKNKRGAFISSCIMMLVVIAFAVKAVLPAGFMPEVTPDGFTKMVICSGMGEKIVFVPADTEPSSKHQDEQGNQTCSYQFVASAKILHSADSVFSPAPQEEDSFAGFSDETISPTSTIYSFAARGPPSA